VVEWIGPVERRTYITRFPAGKRRIL